MRRLGRRENRERGKKKQGKIGKRKRQEGNEEEKTRNRLETKGGKGTFHVPDVENEGGGETTKWTIWVIGRWEEWGDEKFATREK